MKKKILISLVACFIAAGSFVHYNFAQNNYNMDISLADISVMAQADPENGGGGINCFNDYGRGGTDTRKICEIWVDGVYFSCIDVIDISWVNMLGTCP